MTVWLICDWPDCDNHAEPRMVHHGTDRIAFHLPDGWTAPVWATRCPEHAKETT